MRIFLALLLLTAGCHADDKPKIDVGKLYDEASKDKEDKRTVVAIKKFEYLESRVKPQNQPLIWFDLGICYKDSGEVSKSEEYLTKVVDAKDYISKAKDKVYGTDIIGKAYYWLAEIEKDKWTGRDIEQELKYREIAEASGLVWFENTQRMAELYQKKADALYEVEHPDKVEYLDALRRAKLCEESWPKQEQKQLEEARKRVDAKEKK